MLINHWGWWSKRTKYKLCSKRSPIKTSPKFSCIFIRASFEGLHTPGTSCHAYGTWVCCDVILFTVTRIKFPLANSVGWNPGTMITESLNMDIRATKPVSSNTTPMAIRAFLFVVMLTDGLTLSQSATRFCSLNRTFLGLSYKISPISLLHCFPLPNLYNVVLHTHAEQFWLYSSRGTICFRHPFTGLYFADYSNIPREKWQDQRVLNLPPNIPRNTHYLRPIFQHLSHFYHFQGKSSMNIRFGWLGDPSSVVSVCREYQNL